MSNEMIPFLKPGRLPQDPIFIVGYPRSGTTLVQRLLATQAGLYTLPETHYFSVIEKEVEWESEDHEHISAVSLPALFIRIQEKMGFRVSASEIDELERREEKKDLTSKALFEWIVGRFLSSLHPALEAQPSFRWIEKTPHHANHLERIIQLYPRMQALYILRHPVPAIFSRKLKFPFNQELPLDVLAKRWNRMVRNVERFQSAFARHLHVLRYEDLFIDLEKEFKDIGGFLPFTFNMKAVRRFQNGKEKRRESFLLPSETWKLADFRLRFTNTNDSYRDLFSGDDIAAIEAVVGENMKKYGYESYAKRVT